MVKRIFFSVCLFLMMGVVSAQPSVELKTQLSTAKPYVHQQVIYTVKITTTHPLVRANLQPPSIDGTDLQQLGQAKQTQKQDQGATLYVAQVDYVFISKSSGDRVIKGPQLVGMVQTDNDPYSPYGLSEVNASAPDRKVTILPIPKAFTGDNWLPTPRLTITEDWSAPLDTLKVGETVTHTVILHAVGVMPAQLPTIRYPEVPGVSLYPDKPEEHIVPSEVGVSATKVFKFAVVPTEKGTLQIPEIPVVWWDTQNHRQVVSRIKGVSLTVAPGLDQAQKSLLPPAAPAIKASANSGMSVTPWLWVPGVLSGWFAFFWLWAQKRRSRREAPVLSGSDSPRQRTLWRNLKVHCQTNDADAAYSVALALARCYYPDATLLNLLDVVHVAQTEGLQAQVDTLIASRFDPNASGWEGSAFYAAFKQAMRPSTASKPSLHAEALPPLYPS